MPRVRKCGPPAIVRVKGHWRQLKRRRARKKAAPSSGYFVAENYATGRACGHKHRSWSAAQACARRRNKAAWHHGGRKAQTWITGKR